MSIIARGLVGIVAGREALLSIMRDNNTPSVILREEILRSEMFRGSQKGQIIEWVGRLTSWEE